MSHANQKCSLLSFPSGVCMPPSRISAAACFSAGPMRSPRGGMCCVVRLPSLPPMGRVYVLHYPPLSLDQARRKGWSSGPTERGRACGLREGREELIDLEPVRLEFSVFFLCDPNPSVHTDVLPRPQRTSRRWPRPSLVALVNLQGVTGSTPAHSWCEPCYCWLTSWLINERLWTHY